MVDDVRRGRASELLRLHRDPALLTLVNVWDVVSATAVAGVPGTRAVATASHSIAASYGYPDGERMPRDLMLEAVGRIAAATDLPVTADLEGGYGDPAETVRRAIGLGVVGANIEDQHLPLAEAVARMESVLRAAEAEGVEFVLNARTDVFLPLLRDASLDRAAALTDATARCRAFLEAGAPVVFVPGRLTEAEIAELCAALGPQRLTLLGIPGQASSARMEELGVARVSYGPMPQNVALTALQQLAEELHAGGEVPATMRFLN